MSTVLHLYGRNVKVLGIFLDSPSMALRHDGRLVVPLAPLRPGVEAWTMSRACSRRGNIPTPAQQMSPGGAHFGATLKGGTARHEACQRRRDLAEGKMQAGGV